MLEGVIPNHKEIMALGGPQVAVNDDQLRSVAPNNYEKNTEDLLRHIVVMAAENPQEVKFFFRHKFVARKCACGEALGFKVAQMLQFAKVEDVNIRGDVLRAFIRRKGIGCNGIKLRFVDNTQHHGTQIRRSYLQTDLLAKLDTAFEQKPDTCEVTKTIEEEDAVTLDIGHATASSVVVETKDQRDAGLLDIHQDTTSSVVTTSTGTNDHKDAGPLENSCEDNASAAKPTSRRRPVRRPRNILDDNLSAHFQPSGKRCRRQRHK
ncbi:hypothetical protein P5673_025246 [Acropora cervicornis]|uniref:Uncharacterized protein n=1 Tax=Acropora cervicornis TaxID=6130 RepID=A0AAD9Q2K8_ACRCE|nr:hypothetical protein P5673_025246 [Acropora cervicornis]